MFFIPNSYYIETYGCAANQADSAIMESLLNDSGYIKTSFQRAQYVIINTCAVKQATENKIRARLKELHHISISHPEKKIIITGCLPLIKDNYINKVKKIIPTFSAIVDLNGIVRISEVLERVKSGEEGLVAIADHKVDKTVYLLDHIPDSLTAIVPISEGCHGACTYCCVKNARGILKCYEPDRIKRTVSHYLDRGVKQIYLTSQDCSTYQFNSKNLSDLIKEIHELPHKYFLRLGMINPRFLIRNYSQIVEVLRLPKVYQFLHIPIQSGSNRILRRMNRPYLIPDIMGKIKRLRKEFPYLTLSTDIICGFPGETEYDFYKTINFIKWLRPEILNISQFTTRPGTKAKKMNQLKSEIIKARSTRLSKVFRTILNTINSKWWRWEGEVLVLHEGSSQNQAFARNFAYKNVFLSNFQGDFGSFVRVKVSDIQGFNLYARIIE